MSNETSTAQVAIPANGAQQITLHVQLFCLVEMAPFTVTLSDSATVSDLRTAIENFKIEKYGISEHARLSHVALVQPASNNEVTKSTLKKLLSEHKDAKRQQLENTSNEKTLKQLNIVNGEWIMGTIIIRGG